MPDERAARDHGLDLELYGGEQATNASAWVHVADDLTEAPGTVLAASSRVDTQDERR
jgi:hypothetical protein